MYMSTSSIKRGKSNLVFKACVMDIRRNGIFTHENLMAGIGLLA